jgi:hypothetical protein
MPWRDEALRRLESQNLWGYCRADPPATEPTALAAMALWSYRRTAAATRALDWLAWRQSNDGSLGIDGENAQPCWPTGWGLLAWQIALAAPPAGEAPGKTGPGGPEPMVRAPSVPAGQSGAFWSKAAQRAVGWMLACRGTSVPRSNLLGHDTTIQAWPWTEDTQSWVEPTAINLLALRRAGHASDGRCRDAVAMLLDRMLPEGGWNYGNTRVLGTMLKPNLQSTGLALAALAGEPLAAGHVRQSLEYLDRTVSAETTTASLCYALLGGAAHAWRPPAANAWLEAAYRRTSRGDGGPHKLALLALAAREPCPWYLPPHP